MRQREQQPCLKSRCPRAVRMITLRPGSHAWRLLLLLAICGEYPLPLPAPAGECPDAGGAGQKAGGGAALPYPRRGRPRRLQNAHHQAGGGTGGRSGCIRAPCRSCRPCTRQPSAGILPPPAVTASPGVQAMWSEIIGSRNRWQSVWGPE